MNHRLVLIDRGAEHVHRWKPSCACGKWFGCQRRRKQDAVKQYRRHLTLMRPAKRTKGYKPLPPTPAERLPLDLLPQTVSFT